MFKKKVMYKNLSSCSISIKDANIQKTFLWTISCGDRLTKNQINCMTVSTLQSEIRSKSMGTFHRLSLHRPISPEAGGRDL